MEIEIFILILLLLLLLLLCIIISYYFTLYDINPYERNDYSIPMNVYVINLKRNTKRLQEFKQMYDYSDMSNMNINIIEAVDGKSLQKDELNLYIVPELLDALYYIDKTGEKPESDYLTRGMIGCYLSHLNIYKDFVKSDKEFAMILEDDAVFNTPYIYQTILDYMNIVPDDWDIILLGYINIFDKKNMSEKCDKIYRFWGTQGYIISKKGAQKMLDHISIPLKNQIDHDMGVLAQEKKLNIYAPVYSHISQQGDTTDVQIN